MPFLKHRVQIETVVAAVVIVVAAAVAAIIPDALHLIQRARLLAVQFIQKPLLHRTAPAVLTSHRHLQGFVNQILFGGHDVGNVTQAVGIKGRGIDMHMDAAGLIGNCPGCLEFAHQLLHLFDVLPSADRADHLGFIAVGGHLGAPAVFPLRCNTGITHEFPLAALGVQRRIGVVPSTQVAAAGSKIFSGHLCRILTGDAGHFNFNTKALGFHVHSFSPPMLTATRLSEQLCLMFRGIDHQVIALIAAFVETHATLRVADEVVLALLQLQGVNVELGINVTGVEQELVGGNGEQGLGVLPDALNVEVLQILRGNDDRRVLLAHTLGKVADILHGGKIGQEQVKLINAGGGIAVGEQLIAHVGQDVEQQSVFQTLAGLQKPFHAKGHEAGVGDIGVSVKEFRLRTLADGVQPQQDILQQLGGIELAAALVIGLIFFLNQPIQVGQNGIIGGGEPVEAGAVADAELGIQLLQHDFNGVNLPVGKVLVSAEEVFQKGNVLTELAADAEGLRRIPVLWASVLIPSFGFQHIDDKLPGHQVDEAGAEVIGQILVLHFRIKGAHIHAGFPEVTQDELQKVRFALTAVAQDEDVGVGLVIGTAVEIHQHVAAELIPPHIEAVCIGLAGVVEGIQVGYAGCRKHTLKLVMKHIPAAGHHALEALLLAEHQPVHIEFGADELGHHLGLEEFELIIIMGRQLNVHSAMEEGFPVAVRLRHNGGHILQVALGHDGLLEVIGILTAHAVFVCRIADDFLFLQWGDMAGVDAQGDAVLFTQMPQDGLLVRGSGVLPQRPNTAEGISADEVVGIEFDHRGSDHVQKLLDTHVLRLLHRCFSSVFTH